MLRSSSSTEWHEKRVLRTAGLYGSGTNLTQERPLLASGRPRNILAADQHDAALSGRTSETRDAGPVDDLRRRRRTYAVPCGSTSCRRLDRNPTASAPCARSRTNRAPVLSPHRQLHASCRAGRRPLNARSPPPSGQGQRLEISDLGAADLVLT